MIPKLAVITNPTKRKEIEQALHQLFLAQKEIAKAKDAYRRVDELTNFLLQQERLPQVARAKSATYRIHIKNLFEDKNTQWKSVAMRCWDIEFEKMEKK